jgi:hypothetical protein
VISAGLGGDPPPDIHTRARRGQSRVFARVHELRIFRLPAPIHHHVLRLVLAQKNERIADLVYPSSMAAVIFSVIFRFRVGICRGGASM